MNLRDKGESMSNLRDAIQKLIDANIDSHGNCESVRCDDLRKALASHPPDAAGEIQLPSGGACLLRNPTSDAAVDNSPEPGELITKGQCPSCGVSLRVEYGDDSCEIVILSFPHPDTPSPDAGEWRCTECGWSGSNQGAKDHLQTTGHYPAPAPWPGVERRKEEKA